MPTVTRTTSTGPRWGDSGFTSSTASLKVGKSGTSTYYGYVGFPALNKAWYIKSIKFRMNRTDEYSSKTLEFSSNRSNSWDKKNEVDWSKNFTVSSGTGAKTWDLTAYKSILQGYTGTWYMHIQHGSGSNSYCEFAGGTGSSSPRLIIEYEEATIDVPNNSFTVGTQSSIVVGTSETGMTHTLKYSIGSIADSLIASNITAGSTVNWTPPTAIAEQITTSMSGTLTLTLESYLNGTLSSTVTFTYPVNIPTSYVPTIGTRTFSVVNPSGDPLGNALFVQGRSRIQCTINASSVYGATITQYKATIAGVTYTKLATDENPNVIISNVLNVTGTIDVVFEVVDSRGQKATATSTGAATIYAYAPPVISSFTVTRALSNQTPSNSGTYILYTLTYSFSSLNGKNTPRSGNIKYKLSGSSSYGSATSVSVTSYAATVSGVIGAGTIGSGSYMVQLTLTDIYNSVSVEAELPSQLILADFHHSGSGVAIGGEAVTSGLFDVYTPSYFREPVTFAAAPIYASRSAAIRNLTPYCMLSNPTADSVSYSSSERRAFFLNFNQITQTYEGAYAILLGGSNGTRQMGWIIPEDGCYRTILAFRMGTNNSDVHAGISRLANTWTPPSANYMVRDTLLNQEVEGRTQYFSRLSTSTANISGSLTYDFVATEGQKILPWVCVLDAQKTINAGDTWASIQRIG